MLALTDSVRDLAAAFLRYGRLPEKAAADAIHIATATLYGCEYLLTWNCRHIANAGLQRGVRKVAAQNGFELPILCTPEELMGDDE
jgi:predicted nucleic acid-binding protein